MRNARIFFAIRDKSGLLNFLTKWVEKKRDFRPFFFNVKII